MLKRPGFIFCLVVAICLPIQGRTEETASEEKFRIACAEGLVANPIVADTLTKIYGRIGLTIELKGFPQKRSITLADMGLMDAECSRIYDIDKTYTNLVRVPTPIYTVRVGLYSLKSDEKFQKWQDLGGYKIGLLGGTYFASDAGKYFTLIPANGPQHLFDLLLAERIDFALLTDVIGPGLIAATPEYRDIRLLNPAFMEFHVYHYVHKKHSNLVTSLDQSIQALQASGDISLHKE